MEIINMINEEVMSELSAEELKLFTELSERIYRKTQELRDQRTN